MQVAKLRPDAVPDILEQDWAAICGQFRHGANMNVKTTVSEEVWMNTVGPNIVRL